MRYETVTDSFIQLPEKSAITGKKVRVQITPLKVVDPSGEEITVPSGEKYLPLTGGTLTGNLNVNANLYVQNKKIEPVIITNSIYAARHFWKLITFQSVHRQKLC